MSLNLLQKENVGEIVLGDKVRISDPCYDIDTWCAGTLENVLEGKYKCFSQNTDEGDWGIRVASIEVRHVDFLNVEPTELQQHIDVGVDSGQAGIYDLDYFAKNREDKHGEDKWYHRVCNKTGGYFDNPDYVTFTNTLEYKAAIMKLRKELDGLKETYNELNIEDSYLDIINEYLELERDVDVNFFDMSDIIDTLKSLSACLSDDYVPPKRTEAEEKLSEICTSNRLILHKLWNEYKDSKIGNKKCWKNIASTLDNKCLVSSSGYGDGSYVCLVGRNKENKIVSIKIDYFYGCDEDEYDEDYED